MDSMMTEIDLPEEVWALISGFVDVKKDLNSFRLTGHLFNKIGSIALLDHLRSIDKTLALTLPQNNAISFLKEAAEKIFIRQQNEVCYLKEHHPTLIEQEADLAIQPSTPFIFALKSLKARDAALNKVNSNIIISKINIDSTKLDLSFAHITRLPIPLFEDEEYVDFWKKLLVLNCSANNIAMLDVQACISLQSLNCCFNKMIWLNVKNLPFLQELDCSANLLTMLETRGLISLKTLKCNTNKIAELKAQGLFALTYLDCTDNLLDTLIMQGLSALQTLYCKDNKLCRFNGEGLIQLQVLDCRGNPLIELNLQNLITLQNLYFDHTSSLLHLNLTGVQESVKKPFTELENTLLFSFKALSISSSSSFVTPEEKQLNIDNAEHKKLGL